MLRPLIAALCLLCLPAAAAEEQVVLGLSQDRVAITANFDGSEILIFRRNQARGPDPRRPPA